MTLQTQEEAGPFLFVGNDMSLDWINTEIAQDGQQVDLWRDGDDLLAWMEQAALMTATEADALRWGWTQSEKENALTKARTLRARLRQMAEQAAAGQAIDPAIVAAINATLAHDTRRLVLTPKEYGYGLMRSAVWKAPADLLAPVAEAAARLLADGDLSLVRKCENPACVLYFYDNTKNHARRWCRMSACGNRHKAATHYRRVRESKGSRAKT